MSLWQELIDCYVNKKGSAKDTIANYSKKLAGEEERNLFKATTRLLGAYCASPAFNKSRQLDILAENDDYMKVLKVLIREYDGGVEQILDIYDEYFAFEEKPDFWEFFNKKMELPDDWRYRAYIAIKGIEEDGQAKYYVNGMVVLKDTMRYDYREDKWVDGFDSWFHYVVNSNDADPISEEEARKIVEENGGKNF